MADGIIMMITAFVIVILAATFGTVLTKKYHKTNDPKKNMPLLATIITAVVFTIAYFLSVKNNTNIDFVLSWLILTIGLYFSASVVFFICFIIPKMHADG